MGLIAFLLRASRGVIVLSVLAGLTAGVAGVGLIALIQHELAREPVPPRRDGHGLGVPRRSASSRRRRGSPRRWP